MSESRADHEFSQALAAVDAADATVLEKVEMLMEMALGLQHRPKAARQLQQAVALYDRALGLCPPEEALAAAQLRVHKASALKAIPDAGGDALRLARIELEAALPALSTHGAAAEEVAAAEMSLGVVLQTLAGMKAAKITDAIAAYQRAARVFDRERYPKDFAILQNNLATAYLSIPVSDERAKMREALAVQAFGDALKVVSLLDDPVEYAMLQNNLGNALQYAASGHAVQNGLRALEAYDEALKVRNPRDTPLQYANTIANKANCLCNLPDDCADPGAGNRARLREAGVLYGEASRLFRAYGELEKAEMVEQARAQIASELGEAPAYPRAEPQFGESRL